MYTRRLYLHLCLQNKSFTCTVLFFLCLCIERGHVLCKYIDHFVMKIPKTRECVNLFILSSSFDLKESLLRAGCKTTRSKTRLPLKRRRLLFSLTVSTTNVHVRNEQTASKSENLTLNLTFLFLLNLVKFTLLLEETSECSFQR